MAVMIQRFADRSGHLVDRGLTGDADRRQRVVDAPDGSEEADERRRRSDGREKRQPVLQAALHVVETALDAHADPGVAVDVLGQRAGVMLARLDAGVGDEAERTTLLQRLDRAAQVRTSRKKVFCCRLASRLSLRLS
jgi:exopolyphosphatase/pppGpp-phosphohydrolase